MMILRLLSYLLLILCTGTAYAQTSQHPFNNGFTLSVSETAESGLAGMSLLIYGGTQYETAGQHGTYRLVLDTLLRGTEKRSAEQIGLRISELGDSLKTYITGDYWAIEATVVPEHVPGLLELIHDMVQHPLFLEEELEKAKKIAVQTILTQQDSPFYQGIDLYRAVFYPDFYASPETMIRNIEQTEQRDIQRIYKRFFNTGNMVLALSGTLNRDHAIRAVSATFGSEPAGETVFAREILVQQPGSLAGVEERRGGITQAGIIVGTRLEGFERRDALLIDLVNAILDNSLGGRLFEELRNESGLVYSITPHHSMRIQPYTWFILATTRKRNTNKVIRITKRVMRDLAAYPPSEDELGLAKKYTTTRLASSYQSPLVRARFEAERLIRGETVMSLEQRFQAIENVTLEQIHRFIDRYAAADWTTLIVR
jgi:predicted Zn-dependent peptidase